MNMELLAILLTVMLVGILGLALAGLTYLSEEHFGWENIASAVVGFFGGAAVAIGGIGMFGHWLYYKVLPWFA